MIRASAQPVSARDALDWPDVGYSCSAAVNSLDWLSSWLRGVIVWHGVGAACSYLANNMILDEALRVHRRIKICPVWPRSCFLFLALSKNGCTFDQCLILFQQQVDGFLREFCHWYEYRESTRCIVSKFHFRCKVHVFNFFVGWRTVKPVLICDSVIAEMFCFLASNKVIVPANTDSRILEDGRCSDSIWWRTKFSHASSSWTSWCCSCNMWVQCCRTVGVLMRKFPALSHSGSESDS